jgi:hypothetical protein
MLFRSGKKSRDLSDGRDRACHSRQRQPIVPGIGKGLSPWYAFVVALSLCGQQAAHGADATLDVPEERGPVNRPN